MTAATHIFSASANHIASLQRLLQRCYYKPSHHQQATAQHSGGARLTGRFEVSHEIPAFLCMDGVGRPTTTA